ncbi:hypothetical protein AXF42_Ash010158 [Apostasia shenzhenica]|uniref:Uncharacterized protein n=1 Tax=Apostasia shenzhenica TaxID=1088818 RepID=A0A2I0A9P4_9ASPA|nr:hypothetical protein AXF42_Ash010158 [Apostasia shenzhenica]
MPQYSSLSTIFVIFSIFFSLISISNISASPASRLLHESTVLPAPALAPFPDHHHPSKNQLSKPHELIPSLPAPKSEKVFHHLPWNKNPNYKDQNSHSISPEAPPKAPSPLSLGHKLPADHFKPAMPPMPEEPNPQLQTWKKKHPITTPWKPVEPDHDQYPWKKPKAHPIPPAPANHEVLWRRWHQRPVKPMAAGWPPLPEYKKELPPFPAKTNHA